jgi:hypothetical protein
MRSKKVGKHDQGTKGHFGVRRSSERIDFPARVGTSSDTPRHRFRRPHICSSGQVKGRAPHRQKDPATLCAQQSARTVSHACHLISRCFRSDDGQDPNCFVQRLARRARPGRREIVAVQDRKSPHATRRRRGARVGGPAVLSHSAQDRAIRPVALHCSRRSRQA